MPKYQFPLQSALDLRIRHEEQAQCRLAGAQAVARDRRADLQRTQERHDTLISMLRGSSRSAGATVALGEIEHTSLVLADLRRRLMDQQRRLEKAEGVCEARRAELVAASQARGTLERLSERRNTEHLREQTLREQRELNEAAISRHRVDGEPGMMASLTGDFDSVA